MDINRIQRIVRIVSDPTWRIQRLNEIKNIFKKLHYPQSLLNFAEAKALSYNQSRSSNSDSKKTEDPFLSLVINNETVFSQNILKFQNLLPAKIRKIRRKPLSIIEFMNFRKNKFCSYKCSNENCLTCKNILPFNDFIYVNDHKLSLNSNVSCFSTHCIYVIFCSNCSVFYIGKSQTQVKSRFNLHRYHLNSEINQSTLPITRHLKLCSNSHFYFTIIYNETSFNNFNLVSAENYFINLLNPPLNS